MISICIGIKNRTMVITESGLVLNLFRNLIDSIVNASKNLDYNIEIVIVDYNSTDVVLEDWIYDVVIGTNIELNIIKLSYDEPFSRGKSLNIAGKNAKYDNLFFCDADMLLNSDVLNDGLNYIKNGKIYFPICLSFIDNTHKKYWLRTAGWGMLFIDKNVWINYCFPEYYTWGKEDVDIRNRLIDDHKSDIIRKRCVGLYHQWHPIVNESTTKYIQKTK